MTVGLRPKTCSLAAIALAAWSSAAFAHGPITLTTSQLDEVTAGTALNVASTAVAGGGDYDSANINGGGASSLAKDPSGVSFSSGVAGATASAFSLGGSVATGVSASGFPSGRSLVEISDIGTVNVPHGSISIGFTYVAGVVGGANVLP